ncbi:MAG: 60S ribosomal export protein NMD3 [Methanospirillaceae archaeon]|nr:60S ribosomal export protein NMD3 [Methanospirillaceae archaeon]
MNIIQSICPRCGSPSREGNLCDVCLVSETEWMQYEPRVFLVRCQSCGSLKKQSQWSDEPCNREEIEYESAGSAIHLHKDLSSPEMEIRLESNSENRTFAYITVTGILYGISVRDECSIEIIWQNEACDRCRRLHGNYYEGIIQVRAVGRKATQEEEDRARDIALSVEQELQESGDRLSFISKIEEGREGLDIIVGSQAIGEQIARTLVRRLGGRYTMHPTLIGEKDGKKIYRITYSVRFPRYTRGDIIRVKGVFGEVLFCQGRTMTYLDLRTGDTRNISDTVQTEYIGNIRDADQYAVIYTDGDMIGIMDSVSGETREIKGHSWRPVTIGDMVRIFQHHDLFLVM